MHVEANLVSIIFHLLLFSLLSYKLWELIKKYALPFLSQQIRIFTRQRTELLEKDKLLTSTIKRVDNQIKHQKKMFVLLEKKVQHWHGTIQEKNRKKKLEQKKIVDQIKEKRVLQERSFTNSKMAKEFLPTAFESAEKKLLTMYEAEKGEKTLSKILNSLGRG